MALPQGMEPDKYGRVFRLIKSLYGLKQAPYIWNKEIDDYLRNLGFSPTEADCCIYVKLDENGKTVGMISLYVDDLIIAGDKQLTEDVKLNLSKMFDLKDLGDVSYCLGFEVVRDRSTRTLVLHQRAYTKTILERTNMLNCKIKQSPQEKGVKLDASQCPQDHLNADDMLPVPYRSVVGSLIHLVQGTRPDISTAVNVLCRYQENPGRQHWKAAKHVLRYLKGTMDHGVTLGGDSYFNSSCYADSSWSDDADECRSTFGYYCKIGSAPVLWRSSLTPRTMRSSCEAELFALAEATSDVIWLRRLLSDLGFPQTNPSPIYQDNQSSIEILKTNKYHTRIRHIDNNYFFARQRYLSKEIVPIYCPSEEMPADIFTKALGSIIFQRHIKLIGMQSAEPLVLKKRDIELRRECEPETLKPQNHEAAK